MTKGVLIETVLQRVNGIQNQDVGRKVRYEDVEALLSAACNFAMTKQYYLSKQEGINTFPDDFIGNYKLTVAFDTDMEEYYVDLPRPLLSMTNNRGLRYVTTLNGTSFAQTTFLAKGHNKYYENAFNGVMSFYLLGQKVYLRNISSSLSEVFVGAILSATQLEDDDEVPMPAGEEWTVINILIEFLLGQRQVPVDMKNNNNPDK